MSVAISLQARIVADLGGRPYNFDIDTQGGILALVGPNGAGKTTLLRLILGDLEPMRGRIAVGEVILFDSATKISLPLEHRKIGYVPQNYALFPHLTVAQNLDFALGSLPLRPNAQARASRIDHMLEGLKLAGLANRRPSTISGGERQRVALARALCVQPRALLLDEPLAALDVDARQHVRGFLARCIRELSLPTIIVTHDAADARALCDRIAVLERGTIVQVGTWEQLAAQPISSFARAFVATTCSSAPRA